VFNYDCNLSKSQNRYIILISINQKKTGHLLLSRYQCSTVFNFDSNLSEFPNRYIILISINFIGKLLSFYLYLFLCPFFGLFLLDTPGFLFSGEILPS